MMIVFMGPQCEWNGMISLGKIFGEFPGEPFQGYRAQSVAIASKRTVFPS